MTPDELQERTRTFAVDVMRFARGVSDVGSCGAVVRQLVRAATSVAANYRACCRGRSRAEFNAKLGVVAEEADETVFWLEMVLRSGLARGASVAALLEEARQLRAIMAASAKTARRNLALLKSANPENQINK